MVKAAKTHKRRACAIDFKQSELSFNCASPCKHPVFPFGKIKTNQPFYPFLQRSDVKEKTIGNTEEVTKMITSTIRKGLILLKAIIKYHDFNLLELKSVTAIITTYLPDKSRDLKVLRCHRLWGSFSRNLSRSIRRTSLYRLSLAVHEMGNEIPFLKTECIAIVNKIYRLIKGDHGKIKTVQDRKEWESGLEAKPEKYIMVGTMFYTKL
jgi:hypothetical protein